MVQLLSEIIWCSTNKIRGGTLSLLIHKRKQVAKQYLQQDTIIKKQKTNCIKKSPEKIYIKLIIVMTSEDIGLGQ